jgi:DNA polymerase III alpha subunit
MTKDDLNRFIDYVMSFYGADGLYPITGINRTIARKATNDVMRIAKIKKQLFCGDSYDREQVADMLCNKYNMSPADFANK